MKKSQSTIAALALTGITGTTFAEPKIQLEALGEFPTTKQAIVRTTATSELPGNIDTFAFADFYGRSSNAFYSEANINRKFYNDLGLRLEWNGGSVMNDTFRAGPSFNPRLHDKLFLDMKFYPLTVGSNSGVKKTGQVGLFGRLDLPGKFFVENWTDFDINYGSSTGNRRLNVLSETTFGREIIKRLYAEVQAAYNVNVKDKVEGRAGLRYKF